MNLYRLVSCLVLTLLIFANSAAVQAQIYKCQENGKTVYRDEPCNGGKGETFNLGATIEDTDPTGTLGDISGSWNDNGHIIKIGDALGILDRPNSVLSLYLIPDRFTTKEVQHFQDTGDDSMLRQKPAGNYSGFSVYPFLKFRIRFAKDQPRRRESVESAELELFGVDEKQPQLVKLDAAETKESIRYISIYEDIGHGDINLESDREEANISWKISVKAPLYYH